MNKLKWHEFYYRIFSTKIQFEQEIGYSDFVEPLPIHT